MTETEYNKILKQYYGYESLKLEQYKIISSLLENKIDVIGILPTGYGKSVIFQLPYLITKKSVLIISPLIALMNDQESNLLEKNIPVLVLNSTNNNKYSEMHKVLDGEDKIIYITPEYLLKCEQFVRRLSENNRLSLICFDEVHTMHEWGNSFRDAYLEAKKITEWIENIPILALSATITSNILAKTKELLKLENAIIIKTSFDRPNLYIEIRERKKVYEDLYSLLEKYKNEYIIIYCQTRKNTEKIMESINELGIVKSLVYHAGQSLKERNEVQQKYRSGECKCIVATVAFGMGIDIKNIRLVVYYNAPNNLEQYYQGIGRAGRDGEQSECYVFYSNKDFQISKLMIKDIEDIVFREEESLKLKKMQEYITSKSCRRKLLLEYFDEKYNLECNKCDNCKKAKPKRDITDEVYNILKIVSEFNHFGKNILINIIRGSQAKTITFNMRKSINYGFGRNKSNDYWKDIIIYLINSGYLEELYIDNSIYTYIKLSDKGSEFIMDMIGEERIYM